MAIAQEKTILPLQFAASPPYGFVSDYQAIRVRNLEKSLPEIIRGILSQHSNKSVRRGFVSALCNSRSYHAARSSLTILQQNFSPLTRKEKPKIFEASTENDQIRGFNEVTRFISKLRKEFESDKD